MKKINFRFNSFILGVIIIFFLAVAWPTFSWAKKPAGLIEILFFIALMISVFILVDSIFLMYFKFKHGLWRWRKIDWTLMAINNGERHSPTAVAEDLYENFNIKTTVAVEGVMLARLYILSPLEYNKVHKEFCEKE